MAESILSDGQEVWSLLLLSYTYDKDTLTSLETENYPKFQAINIIPPSHSQDTIHTTKQAEFPLLFSEFQHPCLNTRMANTLFQPIRLRTVSLQTARARDRTVSHGVNPCYPQSRDALPHASELAQMQKYGTSCVAAETDRICSSQTPLPSAHPPKPPCPCTGCLWGTTSSK